jgi:N-acetylmuramoyl-L-alanine amidase CwlA
MDIKWVGAHSSNYTQGREGKTINKIVMHWIVGTLEACDATFANPDRNASAHYAIGDGDIHQYVQESDTAWHAGNWSVNQTSIGIEHEGGWLLDDGTRKIPSDKTHQTSGQLIADICRRYNIPLDREHIRLHSEYSATQCPGSLDVNRIIEIAKNYISPPEQPSTDTPISDPKIKLDLGKPWGIMELQAIISNLNDQKRDLETCQKNCEDRANQAVELALSENNTEHKLQIDDLNKKIDVLKSQTAENLDWSTLFSIAWKKWWRRNE